MNRGSDGARRIARQKTIIQAISIVLIVGGLFILFALKRMPVPVRIIVGLTDIVAGATLLVLVRQKWKS
jgi:hypothetical protein